MTKISFLKQLDAILGRGLCFLLPRPASAMNNDIHKILFIRPGGIGDAALLVPAVNALKKQYPGSQVDVLAETRNAGVFVLAPEVGRVFRYDRPVDLLACLRRKYDVVIDTEQWHRLSAVISRLIRARRRVGFASNERQRMFSEAVDYVQQRYEVDSFLSLLGPLDVVPEVEIPFLKVAAFDRERARSLLQSFAGRQYVVIFPGASIAERKWGTKRFSELARRIGRDGLGVVVVGGKEDKEAGDRIVEDAQNTAINLAGQSSLAGTAAVLADARLLISGDSGILHIGVGLGCPTVSLFGAGIEEKWAPRLGGHITLNKHLACSPCTRFGYTPKCPYNVECMNGISVQEVYDAAQQVLARGNLYS